MRRESFRILKVFGAPPLFLVTPFICSCPETVRALSCLYLLLGSRAGTAELAVLRSRGSFGADRGHRCSLCIHVMLSPCFAFTTTHIPGISCCLLCKGNHPVSLTSKILFSFC